MSFNVLGALILMLVIIVVYPFLHRIPKVKIFMAKWYFWTILGAIFFVVNLVIYIRVSLIDNFLGKYGIHSNPPTNPSDLVDYNGIISLILFLSISSFGTMFLPLSFIFNPTRKIAGYLAPILVLGGFLYLITGLAGHYAHKRYDLDANGHYTFMGVLWNSDGTVIRHFLLGVSSYLILFNTPSYKLRSDKWYRTDTFKITAIWVSYLLYCGITTGILYAVPATSSRAGYDVNGLFPRDWGAGGQYEFASMKKLYPLGPIILYIIIISLIISELFLLNKIKTYKSFEYHDPDYWYIKSLGGPKHKWWQW